jgi:predicted Zn finger-like uncharacterized protein
MLTRCPNCNSTFRVTDAVLQMADGEVQCGSCNTVFNAMHALFDDSGAAIRHPAAIGDSTGTGQGGEDDEGSLEFNAPEQDWQRFFIAPEEPIADEGERAEPGLGADFDEPPPETVAAAGNEAVAELLFPVGPAEPPTGSLDEETSDTDTWRGFLKETGPEEADEPAFVIADDSADLTVLIRRGAAMATPTPPGPLRAPESDSLADEDDQSDQAPGRTPSGAWPLSDGATEPLAAALAPPAVDTVLDWDPDSAFPGPARRASRHTGRWVAASVIAALALGMQAIHHFRDVLAADPRYGSGVRAAYERLGVPLYPSWPLDAYELRGAKAIAENSAPGALDIIAEIAVTGRQPVGLPMVRVVLRDRWANPLASGVFDSTTYLAEAPSASRVYTAGTLIPVAISLKDPGTSAQGYELDVCLPDRHFGLQCKSARDPFRR